MFPGKYILLAAVLGILVLSCSEKRDNAQTIPPDSSQAAIRGKTISDSTIADRFAAKARQFAKKGRSDSVLVYYEKASEVYGKEEDWEGYIECLNMIGWHARETGDFIRAKKVLNKAMELGTANLGAQHSEVALSYRNLGMVLTEQGEYGQAEDFFKKALGIRLSASDPDDMEIVNDYTSLGIVYWKKGDFSRAIDCYEKALLKSEHKKEINPTFIYSNLGVIYAEKGDYDLAIEFLNKALALLTPVYGENSPRLISIYGNLGIIYQNKGDNKRGIFYLDKTLSILLPLVGEQHPNVALCYNNLGSMYRQEKEYNPAIEYFNKALAINRQIFGEQHPSLAEPYSNLGSIYQSMDNANRASEYHKKALSILISAVGEHHPQVAAVYRDLAAVHAQKGDYDQALTFYQLSLKANTPDFRPKSFYENPGIDNPLSGIELLKSLNGKARTLAEKFDARQTENLKDLEAVVSTYQLACRLINRMRSSYRAEGSKLQLAEETSEIYDRAVQTSFKLYRLSGQEEYKEAVFQFVEESKAGILLQALSEVEAKHFARIPDSLLKRENLLRVDLAFYEKSLSEEQLKKEGADSARIFLYQSRVFDLNRKYEALLGQFERDYPDYFNLKYQVKTASVQDIQKQFPDANSALVEYFVGKDSIFILTVGREKFDITGIGRDALQDELVEDFREGITGQNYQQYADAAYQLYRILLEPVNNELTAENLLIIPDGLLNYIPFEALLSEEVNGDTGIKDYRALPYLVKKYAISYAYSATLLLETLNRRREEVGRDYLACAPIFAEGMPGYTRGVDLLAANHPSDSTRLVAGGFLPASREEVLGIQELFKEREGFFERWLREKTTVYLEKEASEANLKSAKAETYRYLHFATHGFVNENEPKLSGLILAQDTTLSEDGILYLGEVYNLTLNADLVVLSACETGLGKIAKGEGLIGLTRGFLYAGAQNLLVSLWQVNDASTSNLMVDFYRNMLDGKNKTAALREAKLALMESDSKYARPFYWAPFVLIGN